MLSRGFCSISCASDHLQIPKPRRPVTEYLAKVECVARHRTLLQSPDGPFATANLLGNNLNDVVSGVGDLMRAAVEPADKQFRHFRFQRLISIRPLYAAGLECWMEIG